MALGILMVAKKKKKWNSIGTAVERSEKKTKEGTKPGRGSSSAEISGKKKNGRLETRQVAR